MVKRPTWILLAVLALAVGAYFLIKNQSSKANALTPTPTANSFLITQADGVLQSLRISDGKGNTFQMQRDLSKAWVITAPTSGAADQGLAGAAETQVGALSIVTILESGASHKIEVGSMTPTSSGYYVRFDSGKTYIIAQSGIDALVNLLTAPPFPATATPVATAEATSTPTP